MNYNPEKHNRQSIRLKQYDYASEGMYFITICSYQKQHLFGEVVDNAMILSDMGKIVRDEWLKTPTLRPNVSLGEYVVMPNHLHLLLCIELRKETREQQGSRKGVLQYAPTIRSPSQTIGAIIRGYKGATTKQINILRETPQTPVWQPNYYEHIVRSEKDCNRIREYIQYNPQNWEIDEENQ
jgi:putative transposase